MKRQAKLDTQSLNSEYRYPECIKYSHISETVEKNRRQEKTFCRGYNNNSQHEKVENLINEDNAN